MSLKKVHELYKGQKYNEALCVLELSLKGASDCPYLWLLRGHLVQLSTEPQSLTLKDAEISYLRALEIDPDYVEALESLAHFHDVVIPTKVRAREYAQLVLKRIEIMSSSMRKIG